MADQYLSFEIVRGRERWHFRYINWWRPRRKHEHIKWSTKTWAEADGNKAEEFVRSYWQKFHRLKDADCFNCGEPHPYPYELCIGCQTAADIQAGRLRYAENRRGDLILVPVPYQQAKAVEA